MTFVTGVTRADLITVEIRRGPRDPESGVGEPRGVADACEAQVFRARQRGAPKM